MVATADIGRVAAVILQGQWSGRRMVELEGPKRVTPHEIAATFAKLLGKPVRAEIVPHLVLGASVQITRDEKPGPADSDVGRVQ